MLNEKIKPKDTIAEAQPNMPAMLLAENIDEWRIDPSRLGKPRSTSDVFCLIHANITEAVLGGKLEDFRQIPTNSGSLILHEDFIEATAKVVTNPKPTIVQSGLEVPTDSQWATVCEELRATGVINLLTQYHEYFNSQREVHNSRLKLAFPLLPPQLQSQVAQLIPELPLGGKVAHLVGILSPFDSDGGGQALWKSFGIDEEDIKTIKDWHKMWECGVVLASPNFTSGPKAHDYLMYAMIKAVNLGITLREQMVENTCVHEGRGHGFVDEILNHYLGHSEKYSTEGIAGALGEDNRNQQSVEDNVTGLFLQNKLPRDGAGLYDINYRIMPVYITKLHAEISRQKGFDREHAWAQIIASSIQAAWNISKIPNLSPDNKHAQFMPEMLKIMDSKLSTSFATKTTK